MLIRRKNGEKNVIEFRLEDYLIDSLKALGTILNLGHRVTCTVRKLHTIRRAAQPGQRDLVAFKQIQEPASAIQGSFPSYGLVEHHNDLSFRVQSYIKTKWINIYTEMIHARCVRVAARACHACSVRRTRVPTRTVRAVTCRPVSWGYAAPLAHTTQAPVTVSVVSDFQPALDWRGGLKSKYIALLAETDHSARSPTPISADALRTAHARSRDKLARWQQTVQQLKGHRDARVNVTEPSYGHHLSMVTHDKRAKELAKGALLNLFAAQELKSRQAISHQELELGLTEHTDGIFCPPPPQCPALPGPYRRAGGECTSPKVPSWGAVHTAYERLLPPSYSDGIWAMRASVAGPPLPSARAVSGALLPDSSRPHPTHNLMFVQFGQFIAHDVSAGVVFTTDENEPISCCAGDGADFLPEELRHWACAAVAAAPDDPFFSTFGHKCLNFVRTQLAPSHDCSLGYGRQMNGVTHYQDLSQIYGSSDEKMSSLRSSGGLLKTFTDYGRELPPLTTKKECQIQKDGAACFDSGDNHGNQIISLTVFHTIWTREHNRVARALARLNPEWDEDTVFYESRRILQAEFQHITYNEWLPKVIVYENCFKSRKLELIDAVHQVRATCLPLGVGLRDAAEARLSSLCCAVAGEAAGARHASVPTTTNSRKDSVPMNLKSSHTPLGDCALFT
ncbi:Chorion peroxidase [Eumeta japonica]|uniref:Chorion peroxidase n=1 Tax=Eumeta variegata TaxID=151549 RepID=A0A4C1U5I7_EUMVA|nr:Chorion peroxidase [Eumeta japonica]